MLPTCAWRGRSFVLLDSCGHLAASSLPGTLRSVAAGRSGRHVSLPRSPSLRTVAGEMTWPGSCCLYGGIGTRMYPDAPPNTPCGRVALRGVEVLASVVARGVCLSPILMQQRPPHVGRSRVGFQVAVAEATRVETMSPVGAVELRQAIIQ